MIDNYKLVLDTHCEVYDLLKPWCDADFWNFQAHVDREELISGAIYVVGREQTRLHHQLIRQLAIDNIVQIIFSNPAEGSDTLRSHLVKYNILDLVTSGKICVIGGGDMDSTFPCLQYDSFLAKILQFTENVTAQSRTQEIFDNTQKPYKFLFLNGRIRPHRKYLIEQFALTGLLDQALWSVLDSRDAGNRNIRLIHNGQDLMYTNRTVKFLPRKYEFDFYQNRVDLPVPTDQGSFVKHHLFDNQWGEIYIKPEPYIDTYFSLVTETVFEYPYSFRTEKIWKPVAIGHPFIAVANAGYYRDLHQLGFKTFGHVIDESFDNIENNHDRLKKIAQVVEDLCQQDLVSFLKECYNVCKYNQQHLAEMQLQVRQEFPDRFYQFIKKNNIL
jgi:hypothetical protein